MDNKHVGYLILGISLLLVFVIFLFNSALKEIIVTSCGEEHSLVCPMNETVNQQTYISLGVTGLLVLVGFLLIFSKTPSDVLLKKQNTIKKDLRSFTEEERHVFSLIEKHRAIFQADLIEKTNVGKAKMTRILDRLEGSGFIERKRRGMTNIVVLKTSS